MSIFLKSRRSHVWSDEESCKRPIWQECVRTWEIEAIASGKCYKTECPVNKAVYPIMPELRFKKTFPRVIFLNSNMPENWFWMFWEKEEINELPNESADIFQSNMLDLDLDRPNAKVSKYKIWYFCKFMLW